MISNRNVIDLHKVPLCNRMLKGGFSASFDYLGGSDTLIESWVQDAFTAARIEPVNDTGVGLNDKIETISAEK